MTRLALVITIIIALSPTPSVGAWVTGSDLMEWCEPAMRDQNTFLGDEERLMIGLCAGYVQGWLDWNQYYGKSPSKGENERFYLCVPERMELAPIIERVTNYLEENPSVGDFGASSIMLMALEEFTCESAAEEKLVDPYEEETDPYAW